MSEPLEGISEALRDPLFLTTLAENIEIQHQQNESEPFLIGSVHAKIIAAALRALAALREHDRHVYHFSMPAGDWFDEIRFVLGKSGR